VSPSPEPVFARKTAPCRAIACGMSRAGSVPVPGSEGAEWASGTLSPAWQPKVSTSLFQREGAPFVVAEDTSTLESTSLDS
jgi:hypothetical protein